MDLILFYFNELQFREINYSPITDVDVETSVIEHDKIFDESINTTVI